MRWRTDVFGGPGEWARRLTVATALGAFFGAVGPFGTYSRVGIALRMAYWVGLFWTGSLIFGLIVTPAARLGPRLGFPRLFSAVVATIVACIPLAVVVAAVGLRLLPSSRDQDALTWYGETLLVSLPMAIGYILWAQSRRQAGPAAPLISAALQDEPPESGAGTFLRRLPANLGRELVCLQMEDHYVRAHTTQGSTLVLIPLKDAIAELGALPGLRVHRSWWVARAALEGPVNDGRNLKLRLINGLEAPVARTYIAELRAAGWLD